MKKDSFRMNNGKGDWERKKLTRSGMDLEEIEPVGIACWGKRANCFGKRVWRQIRKG